MIAVFLIVIDLVVVAVITGLIATDVYRVLSRSKR